MEYCKKEIGRFTLNLVSNGKTSAEWGGGFPIQMQKTIKFQKGEKRVIYGGIKVASCRKTIANIVSHSGDLIPKGVAVQVASFPGMGLQKDEEFCYVLENLVQKEAIIAERSIIGLLCFMQKNSDMDPSPAEQKN